MNMIFDTHAHYDDESFDADRDILLKRLFENGVCCIVNQGTTVKTCNISIELAEKYPRIYAAVGLHPECLDDNSMAEVEVVRSLAQHKKVVAIGEIGLDYHHDVPKEFQKQVFEAQLKLAAELKLPVVIHDREAHADTMYYLKAYKPKGIVHCFSGSVEMAREVVGIGMYIGMGGVVTFKNSRKAVEVIENIPLENIVLETDAPYLSPVPFRGKRCDSSMIKYSADRIAEIKNISTEEVLKATKYNAERVYNINY